jgi:hypothetical protein
VNEKSVGWEVRGLANLSAGLDSVKQGPERQGTRDRGNAAGRVARVV